MIRVEVVYASPDRQWTVELQLSEGATVGEALDQAAARELIRQAGDDLAGVGVWGRMVTLQHPLQDTDRIELYRKLQIDPKTARRLRSLKKKA
jgi:uncharacterized protein